MPLVIPALVRHAILPLVSVLTLLSYARAETSGWMHQGFTITEATSLETPLAEKLRGAVAEQIDLVCAVGLSSEALTFLRSVPLVVVSSDAIPRTSPGLYSRRDHTVRLTSRIATIGRRPVLLHELLHAYHHQRLADGFRNPAVLKLYEHAKSSPAYAPTSHMMQNASEFFACAGTTYLFGETAQEPLHREKIKEQQPALYSFLQMLFGPDAGTYIDASPAKETTRSPSIASDREPTTTTAPTVQE